MIDVTNACGDEDQICDFQGSFKYKLFPVDDRAAHTSVVQFKAWEFARGMGLAFSRGKRD